MSRWHQIWTVAWWEFRRFCKPRNQLIGYVIVLLIGGVTMFGKRLIEGSDDDIHVAVVNEAGLPLAALPQSRLKFEEPDGRSEGELKALVEEGDLDGLLYFRESGDAELYVEDDPLWQPELAQVLTASRSAARLGELGVSPQAQASATEPVTVTVSLVGGEGAPRRKALRGTALVFVMLSMIMLMSGPALFFAGITGEKQQRVTEQVVSAVSPQTWVDGKLIGISLAAGVIMFVYAAAILTLVGIGQAVGDELPVPAVAFDPVMVALFLLLAVLGVLFWNGIFAAVAVTISDPHSSVRGTMMFVPMIPFFLTMMSLSKPDTPMLRVLALLPGTSSTALTARLVLTDVPIWEVVTAVALLIVGIVIVRRIAGKIFAVGILTYGKEPSLREIWRWVKEA